MNNKINYDNIFLIDTYDNFSRILQILLKEKEKNNLIILNKNYENLKKTIKFFTKIKKFDYINERIVFGSKKKNLFGKLCDHFIILKNLFFFNLKYKLKFSKYRCKNLFFFTPINNLSFRILVNIIQHKQLKAYNFFKLKFFKKKHFLSFLYQFIFNISLDLCSLSFKNGAILPKLVGFKLKYSSIKKLEKLKLNNFKKIPKKSILFIEDSYEQVNQSYNYSLIETKTTSNFLSFIKLLTKNNYIIYYKTHPSYPKNTRLSKLIRSKFKKNIITMDNFIPSEILIDSFKFISMGTTSTQRTLFKSKIIFNFKDFYEFKSEFYKRNFNLEFVANLNSKNKINNKYIFLNKKNLSKLNKFFS